MELKEFYERAKELNVEHILVFGIKDREFFLLTKEKTGVVIPEDMQNAIRDGLLSRLKGNKIYYIGCLENFTEEKKN